MNETLVRRGKKWFRYDAPDKRAHRQATDASCQSDKRGPVPECGRPTAMPLPHHQED
jgi:hypothetical protein